MGCGLLNEQSLGIEAVFRLLLTGPMDVYTAQLTFVCVRCKQEHPPLSKVENVAAYIWLACGITSFDIGVLRGIVPYPC